MPSTALTVGNELLSTTAFAYLPEMRSMIDRERVVIDHLLSMGHRKQVGGERVIIPWKTNRHTNTTRVVTGYENFDQTVRPLGTPGHDSWAYVMRPVMISKRDRAINNGKPKIIDLMKTRLKDTEQGLKAEHELTLLRSAAATGTHPGVQGWDDWNSLNGDDTSDGFIEGAAAGTNSLHNVAKASYTGADDFPGFHNQFSDASGSFNTGGLTGLDAITVQIQDLAGGIPSSVKGYMHTSAAQHLKRAVRAQERYINGDDLDAGRLVTIWNGTRLYVVGRLPTTGATTATDPWSIVFIDWADVKLVSLSGLAYQLDSFETLSGSRVQAACLHLMGQHTAEYLGHCGLLIDANAW